MGGTSIRKKDIKNIKVQVTGKSERGEGYAADIIFVTVTGSKESDEIIHLDLVLKMGKQNKVMREKFSMGDVYLREVFVYDKIIPTFKKFQLERRVKKIFDSVPKCYSTLVLENLEIVVLENLKKCGYEVHDREIPLNTAHIKLVLDNYAKFHATSFAMRDQNQEEFNRLTANYNCLLKDIFLQDELKRFYDIRMEKTIELLKEHDLKLANIVVKLFEKGLAQTGADILSTYVKESVITHGDCWNNNFMFKYENGYMKTPTQVAILDWQLSCIHSPVLDLSYFLFTVSSKEQVAQFDEYLKFYHTKIAEYLQEMGSDYKKLFPFSTLIDHFNKFSIYGLVLVISSLEMMLSSKDDAISFDDAESIEDTMQALETVKPKNQETYRERVLVTIRYYCENVIKNTQ